MRRRKKNNEIVIKELVFGEARDFSIPYYCKSCGTLKIIEGTDFAEYDTTPEDLLLYHHMLDCPKLRWRLMRAWKGSRLMQWRYQRKWEKQRRNKSI